METQLNPDCWLALEVTGSAFELHDHISRRAGKTVLANPIELKRLGSGRHTDRVDAARLAKMLALGTVSPVWVPPQPLREVRNLLYYRERMVSSYRRCANQAKAVLRRNGYAVPPKADVRRWAAARTLEELSAADRLIFQSALRQMTSLEYEITAVEAELARRAADGSPVPLLLTITGVGLITASAIWAIIGDPKRFTHPKQVTRYAGLDPSIVQSGETHYRGRISRNGNGLLRTLLVEAAHVLALHDKGLLGQFYRRKRQQIGHKRAIVALARKLLIVAWRMLLTGVVYRAAESRRVSRKQRELRSTAARVSPRLPAGNSSGNKAWRAKSQERRRLSPANHGPDMTKGRA